MWLYNLENLTKDSSGYIYYKNNQVEHFSYKDPKKEKEAAISLLKRCQFLENLGIIPDSSNCVWTLDKILEENNLVRVDTKIVSQYGEFGISHESNSLDIVKIKNNNPVLKSSEEEFFQKKDLEYDFISTNIFNVSLSDIPLDDDRENVERFIKRSYRSSQKIELILHTKSGLSPYFEVLVVFEDEKVKAPTIGLCERNLEWLIKDLL